MSKYFFFFTHGYLNFVSNLNAFSYVDYILKPVSYEISTNSLHLTQDKWISLL